LRRSQPTTIGHTSESIAGHAHRPPTPPARPKNAPIVRESSDRCAASIPAPTATSTANASACTRHRRSRGESCRSGSASRCQWAYVAASGWPTSSPRPNGTNQGSRSESSSTGPILDDRHALRKRTKISPKCIHARRNRSDPVRVRVAMRLELGDVRSQIADLARQHPHAGNDCCLDRCERSNQRNQAVSCHAHPRSGSGRAGCQYRRAARPPQWIRWTTPRGRAGRRAPHRRSCSPWWRAGCPRPRSSGTRRRGCRTRPQPCRTQPRHRPRR